MIRRAPGRFVLAVLGVTLPVAMLAVTLLYIDVAVHSMTATALAPVQVEMRALATSLNVDLPSVSRMLARAPGVRGVERFAAADVVVGSPSGPRATARLFAVDPGYLRNHAWVPADGELSRGVLLNAALRAATSIRSGDQLAIALPGGNPPVVTVRSAGSVDLRRAYTWLSIPSGEVQGDIAMVPRSLVVDFETFRQSILPALVAKLGPTTPVLNPGLTDLPPVDVELHIAVDHRAYPADPARAAAWSAALQRVLERQAPGQIVVADDAAEPLTLAKQDAANAQILFLFLGIPGFLVAAALGFAAESALAAAHRREEALLRIRGATQRQLAGLTASYAVVAGGVGVLIGLTLAGAAVSAIDGSPIWRDIPLGRLAFTITAAILAAVLMVGLRVRRLLRSGRRGDLVAERHVLERGWEPAWRRHRLDLIAITAGAMILAVNAATGGLRHAPIEGSLLALSFYVLLAPLLLWAGLGLLAVRAGLSGLARWAEPQRSKGLTSWWRAGARWLARRPARSGVALTLGILAVAFGSEVLAFVGTYHTAKTADAHAAFGADLRLFPREETTTALPAMPTSVAVTTPLRFIPVRAGSDRKTILAIDPGTYLTAVGSSPQLFSGKATALARPGTVLVAKEIAADFAVAVGDTLPVTIFPDDSEKSRVVKLRVAGVFRSFAPTEPVSELVVSQASFSSFLLPPPDSFLVSVTPGTSPRDVARDLGGGPVASAFKVQTFGESVRMSQRSLTTLNLDALGRLEWIGAALVSSLGIAVLGAFLVIERRRELAVLRTIGATTRQTLTGPLQEGAVAALGAVIVGIPLGLGLSLVATRVLSLFFELPPPLLAVDLAELAWFVALLAVSCALSLAVSLLAVHRRSVAATLRDV